MTSHGRSRWLALLSPWLYSFVCFFLAFSRTHSSQGAKDEPRAESVACVVSLPGFIVLSVCSFLRVYLFARSHCVTSCLSYSCYSIDDIQYIQQSFTNYVSIHQLSTPSPIKSQLTRRPVNGRANCVISPVKWFIIGEWALNSPTYLNVYP